MIYGNTVGGSAGADTFLIVDEAGNAVTAALVDSAATLDATPNDIRLGKTAVTDSGVTLGEKEIPTYNTSEGIRAIPSGDVFTIPTLTKLNKYDFTKLQAIICAFNTSLTDSVAAEKIAINGKVYPVQTTEVLSVITKNHTDRTIEFGIVNDTDQLKIIRYFTYKEIE